MRAKYFRQSILLVAALFLLTLLGVRVYGNEDMLMPLVVCTLFQLLASMAYGLLWKTSLSSEQEQENGNQLSRGYKFLVASGVRMFAAVVTVMAFCFLVDDKSLIKFFAVVFLVFYFIMLIYDTAFFVGVEKKIKQNA